MRSIKTLVAGGATLGLLALVVLALAAPATATEVGCEQGKVYWQGSCQDPSTPITICHVAGLASDPANYVTLNITLAAAVGQAGHFGENGTPNAGHEQDTLGECNPPPPPVDVCPNLEGNQAEVPPGYHLGEDENGRPVCIQDENPPDVCPNIEGVQETVPEGLVLNEEGECVAPPPVDVCPNLEGTQQEVPGGMVVDANGNCVTPVPPEVSGTASVICLLPAGIYQLSGTVDGQAADTVTPATLPGNTRGVTNVVVTRGDTSVRTAVATNGDCGVTTTVTTPPTTVTPPVVTQPPTVTPPTTKPPVVKPKPKAKPKAPIKKKAPVKKPKPNKKPHKAPQTLAF